jgi:Predicted membrane protein
LKAKINKVLHCLSSSIIVAMLVLVILLSGLYFASIRFDTYRVDFAKFVSGIVQHPVQVAAITIGSHGLEPVLRLHDIVIFNDDKTQELLKAEELQVGIDLIGSLVKWQLKPDLLLIRGSKLEVEQDQTGKIILSVFPPSRLSNPQQKKIKLYLIRCRRGCLCKAEST